MWGNQITQEMGKSLQGSLDMFACYFRNVCVWDVCMNHSGHVYDTYVYIPTEVCAGYYNFMSQSKQTSNAQNLEVK